MVLLSLRNCISSDGKASPSQLTFGLDTRFPADYPRWNNKEDQDEDPKIIEENIECFQSEGTNNRKPPRSFISKEANNCKHVWLRKEVRHGLEPIYDGPFEVMDRSSDMKTMDLIIDGVLKKVSIDRIKPVIETNHD